MIDLVSNKIASTTKDFGLIKIWQIWHLFQNKIQENLIKFQKKDKM